MFAAGVFLAGQLVTPGHTAPIQASAKVTATVTNHNTLDVDVFALAGGNRLRLGTVVTSQSRDFDLPAQAINAGQVRLSAEPIGARASYTSDPLTVAEGDRIRLDVAPQLAQSRISVDHGG
jgi:hypothetical protein